LVNDHNKELKAITQKDLDNLLSGTNKKDLIQDFLLKYLAQILHNDPNNSDFAALRSDNKSFSSVAQFQLDMKAAEGTNLTTDGLDDIRKNISGDGTVKFDKETMHLTESGKIIKTETKEELEGTIFLLIT